MTLSCRLLQRRRLRRCCRRLQRRRLRRRCCRRRQAAVIESKEPQINRLRFN